MKIGGGARGNGEIVVESAVGVAVVSGSFSAVNGFIGTSGTSGSPGEMFGMEGGGGGGG